MSTPEHREVLTIVDAASALGDALVSESYLALRGRGEVTALSAHPENLTRFSRAIRYEAIPHDLGEYALTLGGTSALLLVIENNEEAEALTTRTIRAMRRAGVRRLVAAAPLDALAYTVHGTRDAEAPRRELSLIVRTRKAWAHVGTPNPGLLSARRALELVRRSGLDTTLLLHPPILVAPGPASVTRTPTAYAPTASAEITAANAARAILSARTDSSIGAEDVLSEG
ncbi:NAD(P)H-binding protein [Dermabacter sp. Marseille-Q3180]|uniref:NAD(P)H-binding protein n=1 Tax=Dermabacter sp. Marseille-Q3180 TaxID=2758090 RepID=UPI002024C3F0|nr:NAD(P)H-binding protein [Dermabacter sp. Marseille-Q3180]